ncbi:hypothetical protein ACFORH_24440 [Amycolatopsis roodepoortensis]|uniref:Helicase C-terminal domain-containing protein n=1 Tax=Amycolatopsis roodepoortensis TaxID=700274 RepID=A0ABR9LKW7_9PSEU|nr:hypothetical protein [Amycolatopsis roodepoortensis]MBE1581207.1 hypothetical protein [Amycolatopsis roodepoortensis]
MEPYARKIVDLYKRGLVVSVLPSGVDLSDALAVGTEWFGADHPILQCLQLGVAIHHGALPGPFRREIERLLQQGILKVTIASPTLAQGLNLSASAVLFHGLRRGRDLLSGSEFANVIGRAGRAFVDTEGLVLYPTFDKIPTRSRDWRSLTQEDSGKTLRSGLIEIGVALLQRMIDSQGHASVDSLLTYLTGGLDWSLPVVAQEPSERGAAAAESWRSNLALLDIGILSIVGDGDQAIAGDAATQIIADALRDSLWERQLRRQEDLEPALRELVYSRTRHLWRASTPSQRRGWYLAGLGAVAGSELSRVSGEIVAQAVEAETALLEDDHELAASMLVAIAETVFDMQVFQPETRLVNWRDVLKDWIQGSALGAIPGERVEVARFIEADVVYRLVWGMEAARLYETAQNNIDTELLSGSAVAAIETGTCSQQASILIRSGFDHRLAAITAVTETDATFDSAASMRQWIADLDPILALDQDWPTPESRSAWEAFTNPLRTRRSRRWRREDEDVQNVTWYGTTPDPGTWLRVTDAAPGKIRIWSTGFDALGEATVLLDQGRLGILRARRHDVGSGIRLIYRGPGDLLPSSNA